MATCVFTFLLDVKDLISLNPRHHLFHSILKAYNKYNLRNFDRNDLVSSSKSDAEKVINKFINYKILKQIVYKVYKFFFRSLFEHVLFKIWHPTHRTSI